MSIYLQEIADAPDAEKELWVRYEASDGFCESLYIRFSDLQKMASAFGYRLVSDTSD